MALTLEVDFGDMDVWIKGIIRTQSENQSLMKERIAQYLEDTMKEEAPRGATGNLRASISAEIIMDTITVTPDIWYAYFVEMGTGPSHGAYVPGLKPIVQQVPYMGGRVKWGTHQGTPINPFISRTFSRMIREMDTYLKDIGDWFFDPG